MVGSVDHRHFVKSDVLLIVSYIQAAMLARSLARKPTRIKEWELAVRAQSALAVKLRLTPSSRSDHKTIARRLPERDGPFPWEKEEN
ncbi:hypothetical protein ACSHT2_13940 [Bradyrhizobium sp. PUT101]|uniref:hypothetical protein n=1 Tax=Bradyrhizobium sp. PUT101 TaxID=3447427 RepID=UPI003F83EE3E